MSNSPVEYSGDCLVLCPILKNTPPEINPDAKLAEAEGLAGAIGLTVRHGIIIKQGMVKPSTYLTQGHLDEVKALVDEVKPEVVIVDAAISPVQQRNLETYLDVKIIDRTGLIIEIFGERARTSEGKLQVELASLSYQRSRLVRSWTHLERQRGGFGFMGGPGESQIEIDRRLIDERIVKLKKQLESVKRTRGLHRKSRERIPYPIVALVGYTNAGKSTLFNRLTKSQVMAEDMLFATLDPTMRMVKLPSGREIILSDTVGFISNLPTALVAAFHATLEEVIDADLILHVIDYSSPNMQMQESEVLNVLAELGLEDAGQEHTIKVLNKIDKCEIPDDENKNTIMISAANGTGIPSLLKAIDEFFSNQGQEYHLKIPITNGSKIAWVYRNGDVKARRDDDSFAHINVILMPKDKQKFDSL